ncbi:Protein root UVB sensitive 6 [Zea mays]|uniref:Protein root UVB sensitive 6 n=1 Tax=Zea mays TaxID=4577 RepID=A0A1D6FQ25_MAIZE|nr:Protein root UVB sensitive 6 [Zea mays]
MSFIRSYVVPEGFPDSVTPSYVPYMTWRALKVYFFIPLYLDSMIYCIDAFYLILPFFFSAFLWWSNGCVYNKNLAQFCWSLPKQGRIWCCGYQLDTQGKNTYFLSLLKN